MASSSIPTVVTKGDALRFVELEEHSACLSSVGEVFDYECAEVGIPRTSLGTFFKPEVLGHDVPLNYLITRALPLSLVRISRVPITEISEKTLTTSRSPIGILR